MNGFFVIDKPKGANSTAIVSQAKKAINRRDVGHLGTLDPLASGVLPIAVGKCTKLFEYFLSKVKVYEAGLQFGVLTDTLDVTGNVVDTSPKIPQLSEVQQCLPQFLGKILQVPPAYSAKHVDGVRAYDLARKGIEFELPAKEVVVNSIEVLGFEGDCMRIRIACLGGTYIRSLIRDIGAACQTYATMTALRRTKSGFFELEHACSVQDLAVDAQKFLITPQQALGNFPAFELDAKHFKAISNGAVVVQVQAPPMFLAYCGGVFFGLAQNVEGKIKLAYRLVD